MPAVTFKDSDPNFVATFVPVDAKGNPTTADDIPVWSVSDATVLQVSSTTPDGLTATVAIVGVTGTATLAVTSVDINGTVINASQEVTISAGEAVSGTIEISSPTTAPSVVAAVASATNATVSAPAESATPAASVAPDPSAPADSSALSKE